MNPGDMRTTAGGAVDEVCGREPSTNDSHTRSRADAVDADRVSVGHCADQAAAVRHDLSGRGIRDNYVPGVDRSAVREIDRSIRSHPGGFGVAPAAGQAVSFDEVITEVVEQPGTGQLVPADEFAVSMSIPRICHQLERVRCRLVHDRRAQVLDLLGIESLPPRRHPTRIRVDDNRILDDRRVDRCEVNGDRERLWTGADNRHLASASR